MEWVVDRNMPLSEVDHPLIRSMSRLKPISSTTLKKYLSLATMAVEKVIATNIPPEFGIMFDGWQCLSEHYVALIAMYLRNDEMHYDLLALAPLDEAESPIAPFFGTFYRYLANQRSPLRTAKNRAELRRHSQLAPLRANGTRWSSTFTMLERYVRIRDAIKRVDAVYDLIPQPAMHRRIVALYETLKTINSVCKKLQEDPLSMASVRVLFDKMAEMYPITAAYLSPDAIIICSTAFENAVVKVLVLLNKF
ncbi:hypothetical protein PHMEG_0002335 [Phytophthora megakarya]|uniref:Uncharacterized protein n=1 Tax=Phytophthora megakarya TaxID=4795 RepID=A0A225WYX6_9STRA|nr:hypothetical protein PHMEG_0002335 [Phytophthora megakarya]